MGFCEKMLKRSKAEAESMSLFSEQERERIRKKLESAIENEVKVIVFTQEIECEYCKDVQQLMEELSQINEKIRVEVYDLAKDEKKAKELNIDKTPAILLIGKKANTKMRFFGLPAGYELETLLEDLIDTSRGTSELSPTTKAGISQITKPVHIQVFTTLTCPYCARAVRMAHQIALENDLITADMIESAEFPLLADSYSVISVPKVIINGKKEFVGAVPESQFLQQILSAL